MNMYKGTTLAVASPAQGVPTGRTLRSIEGALGAHMYKGMARRVTETPRMYCGLSGWRTSCTTLRTTCGHQKE